MNYDDRFSPFPGGGFFGLFPGLFPQQPGSGMGQPGGPPFQQPGTGAGQQVGPPTTPPPSVIPQQQQQTVGTFAVDPGAISGCLYRFTYVRLSRYNAFWFYPTFVGRRSVAGYRWTGFSWVYFGIDLNRIQSFQCV